MECQHEISQSSRDSISSTVLTNLCVNSSLYANKERKTIDERLIIVELTKFLCVSFVLQGQILTGYGFKLAWSLLEMPYCIL